MAFPPKKNDEAAEEEDMESASESESESESSSNAEKDKMKGSKPNPLRKWAAQMASGEMAGADDEDYED